MKEPSMADVFDDDLWSHQPVAVAAIEAALRHGGRATADSACGTGKTRVAAQAAARLAPQGRVLVMVPSLALVGQILRTFARHGGVALGRVAAVCSDPHVLTRRAATLDVEGAQVTTSPAALADALTGPGRVTVMATYQSLPVLAAAHAAHGLAPWDLAIADEAHRTAGRAGRAWAGFHDDAVVPIRRRLYMTATRKILTSGGDDDLVVSMDDESIYGPVVFKLPTSTAIERKLLADYEIVVPLITDDEVRRLTLEQEKSQGQGPRFRLDRTTVDARTLAAQLAVLRAASEHDLRRIITFHNRVNDARVWSMTLPRTWAIMDPQHRPARVSGYHIHGGQEAAVRHAVLEKLSASPDDDGEVRVVSNARVLVEGVDAPAVDAIVLAAPRNSVIDTVQAVGRALRTGERRDKVARIIVPVFLGPGEDPASALEGSDYDQVWRVICAMRAQDDRLAGYLDQARVRQGRGDPLGSPADSGLRPTWLSLSGIAIPEGFAEAVQVRVIRAASSGWHEYYGVACAYFQKHGNLNVDHFFQTETGLHLGAWVKFQAAQYNAGKLSPERVGLLDEIGMIWSRVDFRWNRALEVARSYVQEHGTLVGVPLKWRKDGVSLGLWLASQRSYARQGKLSEDRRLDLEALDPAWDKTMSPWDANYESARDFFAKHGHLEPDPDFRTENGIKLHMWLAAQRTAYGKGELAPEQIALLNSIGMVWSVRGDRWYTFLEAAKDYVNKHGPLPRRIDPADLGELDFRRWLSRQRRNFRAGNLSEDYLAALNSLDPGWAIGRASSKTSGVRKQP
ncbi:Helicase associated domain protein [Streptosporangium sp. NPDC020072]|uniref:DEAD/DEAH box helicase n=1 Tax=Streptosporangium sp. NPDC020072 TaxID=3154788 RepID=UPI003438ED1F